jgi:hypothetical protein
LSREKKQHPENTENNGQEKRVTNEDIKEVQKVIGEKILIIITVIR